MRNFFQSIRGPMRAALGLVLGLGVVFSRPCPADRVGAVDLGLSQNAAALESLWKPGPGAPLAGLESGGTGVRFTCPFKSADRVFWDFRDNLNLKGYAVIEMEVSCARPDTIRHVGLYLKSGEGWYVWLMPLKEAGRQKLVFPIKAAAFEGKPGGLDSISGVRISVTRLLDVNTAVTVHAVRVRVCDLVLVKASASTSDPLERNASQSSARRITRWLSDLSVSHVLVDDDDVMAGALRNAQVAILAYNPNPPAKEMKALEAFVQQGGKLIVFYSADVRLAELMRVKLGAFQTARLPGQWSGFQFDRHAPAHVPSEVWQDSTCLRPAWPASDSARVIARWFDAAGEQSEDPAWVQSDRGFWMSHVLLDTDPEAKKRLLLALLGGYLPGVWRDAADRAMQRAGKVASFGGYADSVNGIRRMAKDNGLDDERLDDLLDRAQKEFETMGAYSTQRQYPETMDAGERLNRTLIRAYASVQKSKAREIRGVWDHSGLGLYPGDWKKTCRLLSQAGLNTLFVNLLWAGTAHYKSEVVPPSYVCNVYGDQLKQSVIAARHVGLDLHVWKVCWNLGKASAPWAREMKKAGRLQVTAQGKTVDWLCPSNPDNVALELKALAEVARVDGISGVHLDYIRYPDNQSCYCDGCHKRFEQELGQAVKDWPNSARQGKLADTYNAWRRQRISSFVKQVSEQTRRINPRLKVSAAVYRVYPDCAKSLAQDWGLWVKEGWVDFVCPMNYAPDLATFGGAVRAQVALPNARNRIVSGIGVTTYESRLTPDQVVEQILCTRTSGAAGFVLFDLNRALEKDDLPILSLGVTRKSED